MCSASFSDDFRLIVRPERWFCGLVLRIGHVEHPFLWSLALLACTLPAPPTRALGQDQPDNASGEMARILSSPSLGDPLPSVLFVITHK